MTLLSVAGSLQRTGGNKADYFTDSLYRVTFPQSLEINPREVKLLSANDRMFHKD